MAAASEAKIKKASSIPPRLTGSIPQFFLGQDYNRLTDIHLNYGGSRQSGISPSSVCPAIFIFTGESGEQFGYEDGFDSADVFSYTGEGQVGDMTFTEGKPRHLRPFCRRTRTAPVQVFGKR